MLTDWLMFAGMEVRAVVPVVGAVLGIELSASEAVLRYDMGTYQTTSTLTHCIVLYCMFIDYTAEYKKLSSG